MWMLKSNKGFFLIEVMCSVTIFMMIFVFTVSMYIKIINIREKNKSLYQYASFMDALKVNLEYNMNYNDLKCIIEENKIYINYNNIDIDKIENCEMGSIFTDTNENWETYVFITSNFINENSEYESIKISIELIYQSKYGEKKIKYVLFKPKEEGT